MFQSLTGRLKTNGFGLAESTECAFQSLTGRLKTRAHSLALVGARFTLFQSLTGRLKTNPRTPLGAGF